MKWWFSIAIVGFILLAAVVCKKAPHGSVVAKYCLYAKNCTHSQKPKCGMNTKGKLKIFQDTCDMVQFNCINKDNYGTINKEMCTKSPQKRPSHPFRKSNRTTEIYTTKRYLRYRPTTTTTKPTTTTVPPGLKNVIKRMWCWIGDHCQVADNAICARDSQKIHMVFQSNCSMAKFNCDLERDFVQIPVSMDECMKLIKYKICPLMADIIEVSPTHTISTEAMTTRAHVTAKKVHVTTATHNVTTILPKYVTVPSKQYISSKPTVSPQTGLDLSVQDETAMPPQAFRAISGEDIREIFAQDATATPSQISQKLAFKRKSAQEHTATPSQTVTAISAQDVTARPPQVSPQAVRAMSAQDIRAMSPKDLTTMLVQDILEMSRDVSSISTKDVTATTAQDYRAMLYKYITTERDGLSIEVTPRSRKPTNLDVITKISKEDLVIEEESQTDNRVKMLAQVY